MIAINIVLSYPVTVVVYSLIFGRYDREYSLPDEITAAREEVCFASGENTLTGFLYRSDDSSVLVVIASGFAAGADRYSYLASSLVSEGYSVFGFDYSGCCASEGDHTGFSQAALDLDAALDHIEQNSGYGNDHIVLIGHSMGGFAAACMPAFGHEPSAIVTVSGVNSALEGIMGKSVRFVGYAAYLNYPNLYMCEASRYGFELPALRANECIEASGVPALVIQGEDDAEYTLNEYSVYSHLSGTQSGNITCVTVSGGHTDLLLSEDGKAVESTLGIIADFIAENTGNN